MMAEQHGDFVWYELMTIDAGAAQAFYGPIVGWRFEAPESSTPKYSTFRARDTQVGGLLTLTDEMQSGGARPAWIGYIRVDDIEKTVSSVREHEGQVLMEGNEVPGVGPFAMVADPQGAPFYVIEDRSGSSGGAFAKYKPQVGCCAWNELASADPEAAKPFYNSLFGWVKDGEIDMGQMGSYEFLRHDDYAIGAMMRLPQQLPASAWSFYFRVPDIDAAAVAIPANGGALVQEPAEIPGGDYSLKASDPEGAIFGLVGPRKN